MTPEQLAASGTEHAHQCAVFCYAQQASAANPLWALLYAIPNGGMYGDDVKSRMIRGSKMKASGVKPGVPDMFLPVACGNYHGLYIELKKPSEKTKKNGGLSDEQITMTQLLQVQGYCVMVRYGWSEVVKTIHNYLNLEG
jgi:hypothetical protein